MKQKCAITWSAVALLVVAAACSKENPARPTNVDTSADTAEVTTSAATGITITSPVAVSPAVNHSFKFAEQPLTLTVKSATTTGSTPVTYGFEVSADSSFATKAYSKDGIADSGNGQVALRIDRLPEDKVYYWRSRATVNGAAGPYMATRAFTVGPEVVLQAPIQTFPANGGNATGNTPTLTVSNADKRGPAGQVIYRFEVSDSPSFGSLVAAISVAEQGGQTSAQVNANLVAQNIYYWRVQATDPSNAVTGPFSSVSSFRFVPFDMRRAVIHNSPMDMGSWREGAKITSVHFTGSAIRVDFDRREGPNRWPDVVPPGWDGPLQYTLGMCVNIAETWHCSAVVQFWHGRDINDSAAPSQIAREWFYDFGRWGAMTGHQPQEGETVGMFVCEGDCRGNTEGSASPLKERSDVALVPFTFGNQLYTFSAPGQRIVK